MKKISEELRLKIVSEIENISEDIFWDTRYGLEQSSINVILISSIIYWGAILIIIN